ncbi:MAG: hypothetical protein ACREUP_14225 [Burkholderiales bacterium]
MNTETSHHVLAISNRDALAVSPAALGAALFNHLYIWVHYYSTELPDMKRIYGEARATTTREDKQCETTG